MIRNAETQKSANEHPNLIYQDPFFYVEPGTRPTVAERFAIRPHKWAKSISNFKEAQLMIRQGITEITSQNFQTTENVRLHLRDLGYVSLFFFLRYIASYSGPFQLLNENLHLSMCNFRQSDYCMGPGARAASFLYRGVFKTTINSFGGNGWEALRDPDIRIMVVSGIVERAHQIKNVTKAIFDANEFFAWLYGNSKDESESYVPAKNAPRWNLNEIVLPNRTRYNKDPTIQALGMSGAVEGIHGTLMDIDDPIGTDDVDSEHQSNTNMQNKINWIESNTTTLLTQPATDRVVWSATLWAANDATSLVWKDNLKKLIGWQGTTLAKFAKPDTGAYTVYYRKADEGGNPSCPEIMPLNYLENLKKNHPWTYWWQYQNEPISPESIEFYHYEVNYCSLIYDKRDHDFKIVKKGPEENFNLDIKPTVLACRNMDFVLSTDLAFTEKGSLAKVCRTSLAVWAMDSEENAYRVKSHVGKFEINETFRLIGDMLEEMKGYVRTVIIETNAAQKAIVPFLENYLTLRKLFVRFELVNVSTNKVARIRNTLGYFLKQSKLFLDENCSAEFVEEKDIFPNVETRVDVLDESEKGLAFLRKPDSDTAVEEYNEHEEDWLAEASDSVIGY